MKTLSEYNNKIQKFTVFSNDPIRNGITCDVCGEELFDTNPMLMLACIPSKKDVHCKKCGFKGYRLA